jgi:hypothetical protein
MDLIWSVSRYYEFETKSSVESCTGACDDRIFVRKAEESPLLEAIAREWLMKTQQAGKRLSGCRDDM